jgi:hypothetical protein
MESNPQTADNATAKPSLLSRLSVSSLMPARIKVVEVREKDLKPLPLGEERALAYAKRQRNLWLFSGPITFKEPPLPEAGIEMDGSLLPPKPE